MTERREDIADESKSRARREAISKYQGDEPIRFQEDVRQIDAFRTGFDAGFAAAERDTRERCAQIAEGVLKQVGNIVGEEPETSRYHKLGESVAEAIRKGE